MKKSKLNKIETVQTKIKTHEKKEKLANMIRYHPIDMESGTPSQNEKRLDETLPTFLKHKTPSDSSLNYEK